MAARLTEPGRPPASLVAWRVASALLAVGVGAVALRLIARALQAVGRAAGGGWKAFAGLALALLWVGALRGLVASWRLRGRGARFGAEIGLACGAFVVAVAALLWGAR